MPAYTFDRRQILAASGSLGLVAALGGLAACSSQETVQPGGTQTASPSVNLPTYQAYAGVTPDLPGTAEGVQPAFYSYPDSHPQSVEQPPGSGGPLTTMNPIYGAPAPEPPGNAFWVELNKRLGVDLKMQVTPASDYDAKLATTIAGGTIPDVVRFQNLLPKMPQLMEAKFVNLADHISGDDVLKYPNLANLPSAAWKAGVFGKGFYGLPVSRPLVANGVFVRKDLFDAAGVTTQPKSYDEWLEGAKALSDPKKRRWAEGRVDRFMATIFTMSGVPNGWRRDGDKLIKSAETDEYVAGLQRAKDAFDAGVMHPDGFNATAPYQEWFIGGTIAEVYDGIISWQPFQQLGASTSGFELDLMQLPNADGNGLAPWMLGKGFFGFQAISKDSESRIEEILGVCNYLCAPFGTAENFFISFGVEGTNYTQKGGLPTLTERGIKELSMRLDYVASPAAPLYAPNSPKDQIDTQYRFQEAEVAVGIQNPTVGLYSATDAEKGSGIGNAFDDGIKGIIQGRNEMSDLDGLLETWRKNGGDKIRQEYEQQLEEN